MARKLHRHSRWTLFFICACLLPTQVAVALQQNEKLWVGDLLLQPLSSDGRWLYSLYTQTRLINKSHPWQSTLFEGGAGYALSSDHSVWLGFRWIGHEPNNGFFQTYQFWQQMVWRMKDDHCHRFSSRTRLQELRRSNTSQYSFDLRQRLAFEDLRYYFGNTNPLYYDEVFFQLNRTNDTTHQFISQNRVFLGVNLYTSPITFWELGYINQYIVSASQYNQNQMNHILSITYNVI